MADTEAQAENGNEYLEVAVRRLEEGKPVFGARLIVMGSGPLPALGTEGTMAIDDKGDLILIVALPGASPETVPLLSSELDDIASLTEEEVAQLTGEMRVDGLVSRHKDFFDLDDGQVAPTFNTHQRVIMLLEEEPSVDVWEMLISGLGARLSGVYVVEKEAAWSVTPSETQQTLKQEQQEVADSPVTAPPTTAPEAAPPPVHAAPPAAETPGPQPATADIPGSRTTAVPAATAPATTVTPAATVATPTPTPSDHDMERESAAAEAAQRVDGTAATAPNPRTNWLWLGLILLGVAMAIWGITKTFMKNEPVASDPAVNNGGVVQSPLREVARNTQPDATHTQWIGQQRLLRTSDGSLLALYPSDEGLMIVSDRSNQGRGWRRPQLVEGVTGDSFSAAIDASDRIHIGLHNGTTISYVMLSATDDRWAASPALELDAAAERSVVVDLTWDEGTGFANLIWAKSSSEGEQPYWASVNPDGEQATVIEEGALAPAGTNYPVLATIDAGPDSTLLATYRRGDKFQGWHSRLGAFDPAAGTYVWGEEEKVPTQQGIGAVSVAYDTQGTAHMVLRDSTTFKLVYFRRPADGPWSRGQTAFDAEATEEMDFPTSRWTSHGSFTSSSDQPLEGRLRGAGGRAGPPTRVGSPVYPITRPEEIPEGAFFPTSISGVRGSHWCSGPEEEQRRPSRPPASAPRDRPGRDVDPTAGRSSL